MTKMDAREWRNVRDLSPIKRNLHIRIDTHLRRVFDSMDDDFLRCAVNSEMDDGTPHFHWWESVLQVIHCTVEAMGMNVEEFFMDTLNEPHDLALREYEQRLMDGVYGKPVQKYRGETRYNTYDRN